jgi:hypothetical protein
LPSGEEGEGAIPLHISVCMKQIKKAQKQATVTTIKRQHIITVMRKAWAMQGGGSIGLRCLDERSDVFAI